MSATVSPAHPASPVDLDGPFTGPIDPQRWPGLAEPPAGARSAVARPVAERLFAAVANRLPLRVLLPDGRSLGAGDGNAPVMHLHRPEDFHARIGHNGLIGLGESYMAGDWSSPDLTALLTVFAARAGNLIPEPVQRLRSLYLPRQPRTERNTTANTRSNISRHYDLSNDLFQLFLDETMTYSSALFAERGAELAQVPWEALADAQRRKVDSLLDRAGVGEGSRVLEIGTGWGELAIRAAARGASVYSVTLSSEQQLLAQKRIAEAGFTGQVTVDLKDYRAVTGEYDAVVSVEMIEAVGFEYWPTYFRTIDRVLAPGGRVAIQAITMPHPRVLATRNSYTWVHKYIFPGGIIPSVRAIEDVTERHTSLRLRDRFSFGDHYAQTLRLWDEQFAAMSEQVRELGFDDVFRRMWHFYLCYSRAGFESGYLDVQQISFDRRDTEGQR
ncbi:cyclopropane-fatty-acyl-phospholipid synthase family protein [Paenarthrobacter sp. DKR-5]|uniref:class I SAM-dependent methyltransferase n=1 Tax=Paenarthrobacter sp. DKR-5 TaxID=2835535 RepID=UPI001BDC3722|nr:cyclopropane-fatty-acyl-phospholipid synthase family protein [Paenarthrobacter sp. DKR-5]